MLSKKTRTLEVINQYLKGAYFKELSLKGLAMKIRIL